MPAEATYPTVVCTKTLQARFEWAGSGWQWSEIVVKTAAEICDADDREENGGHDQGVDGGGDNEGDEEGDEADGDVQEDADDGCNQGAHHAGRCSAKLHGGT